MSQPISILTALIASFSFAVAQDINVHFAVNMNYQAAQSNFDPADDFVDIAGTFNGWGSTITPLEDPDADGIHRTTISGFSEYDYIEFKFRINGTWDGTEEFPGVGNNRTYTVQPGVNDLYFWYNDEIPPDGPPVAFFDGQTRNVREGSLLLFENKSGGEYESLQWHFEGGQPEFSSDERPFVRYDQVGSFAISLIARGEVSSDTFTVDNMIEVRTRDTSELEWWNDAIFYEIFMRSFKDSDGDGIGDIQGLIGQLDYLNDGDPETHDDLGITGIWLMPMNPSPSYHGYDVTDYMAINPDYGTMDDFQELLDEAHQRGIWVIIDLVMNHCSSQHPWFAEASDPGSPMRDWFVWSPVNPMTGAFGPGWHWGGNAYYYGAFWSGMPDLNYHEPEVHQAMFDIVDFWLSDVGVDGFRLDAVRYLYESDTDFDDLPETHAFWRDYSLVTKDARADAFSVGEAWTSTRGVQPYVEDDGIDVCFEFDLAFATLDAVMSGQAADLAGKMQEVYNSYPHLQFATFLTNHDIDRVWNVLDESKARMKNAASIYLTLPGIPFLYYGEEIGMSGTKPDPEIRKPMQWTDGSNAGFTSGTPWQAVNSNYATFNVATQNTDPGSLLNHYRKLIRIRNSTPTLRKGDYSPIPGNSDALFAFEVHNDGESLVVVHNVSDAPVADGVLDFSFTHLEPGEHRVVNLMDSTEGRIAFTADGVSEPFAFGARETKIWRFTSTTDVREVLPEAAEVSVYPNPAQRYILVELSDEIVGAPATYRLISLGTGQVVQDGLFRSDSWIDVQNLQGGGYLIEVFVGMDVYRARFVVVQ